MAQSIITLAFETYKAQQEAINQPVELNQFVLANVPGLDPSIPIDRAEELPDAGHIVYTSDVTQTGFVNPNAVVYSLIMDTRVGDFEFNWVGLRNKESGILAAILHTPMIQKYQSIIGVQNGNSVTRSIMMAYDGAKTATAINVDASTWQIDFTARLSGTDETERLANVDLYGHGAFYADGFKVIKSATYQASKGVGYVGGLRCFLNAVQTINGVVNNSDIYLDASWQGQLTSAWSTEFELKCSIAELNDYVDANGVSHYVTKIAHIDGSGNVTDLRNVEGFGEYERAANAATDAEIDAKSSAAKHIKLSQLFRAIANHQTGDYTGTSSVHSLTQVGARDLFNAAKSYTDQVKSDILGGVVPEALDTFFEVTKKLEADDDVTANIINDLDRKLYKDADSTISASYTFSQNKVLDFAGNSSWGGKLRIGGNGYTLGDDPLHASMFTTNGNLILNAGFGKNTHLNYHQGDGVYFGNGNGSAVAVMGADGDLWKGDADNAGYKYWHAGNDGADSGLDADTVDGIHGYELQRKVKFSRHAVIGQERSLFKVNHAALGGTFELHIAGTSGSQVVASKYSVTFGHNFGMNVVAQTHYYSTPIVRFYMSSANDLLVTVEQQSGASGVNYNVVIVRGIDEGITTYTDLSEAVTASWTRCYEHKQVNVFGTSRPMYVGSEAVATQDWVNDLVNNGIPTQYADLGTTDLNTLNTANHAGFYSQINNANTAGNNYPNARAGVLQVYRSIVNGVIQVFMSYVDAKVYTRSYHSGSWTSWSMTYDSNNPPSAAAVGAAAASHTHNYAPASHSHSDYISSIRLGTRGTRYFSSTQAAYDAPAGHVLVGTDSGDVGYQSYRPLQFYKNGTWYTVSQV